MQKHDSSIVTKAEKLNLQFDVLLFFRKALAWFSPQCLSCWTDFAYCYLALVVASRRFQRILRFLQPLLSTIDAVFILSILPANVLQ